MRHLISERPNRILDSMGAIGERPLEGTGLAYPGRWLGELRDPGHVVVLLAGVGVAVATVFVEVHVAGIGHGAHLLLFLVIAGLVALRAGWVAAVAALVIGAVGSAIASILGLGPADAPLMFVAQLALYLLAGLIGLTILKRSTARRYAERGAPLPSAAVPGTVEPLTPRELEILRLAASGMTIQEVAARLVVSQNTVKTHLTHVYGKLRARNRSDAVRLALHCGCLSSDDICPHRAPSGIRESTKATR